MQRPSEMRRLMGVPDVEFDRVVAQYMTNSFVFNPKDCSIGESGSMSSGRKKARQSRALDTRSARIQLTHKPTGVAVEGYIPAGHYSKRDFQKKKREVAEKLMPTLEQMVRKYLKELRQRIGQ